MCGSVRGTLWGTLFASASNYLRVSVTMGVPSGVPPGFYGWWPGIAGGTPGGYPENHEENTWTIYREQRQDSARVPLTTSKIPAQTCVSSPLILTQGPIAQNKPLGYN